MNSLHDHLQMQRTKAEHNYSLWLDRDPLYLYSESIERQMPKLQGNQ